MASAFSPMPPPGLVLDRAEGLSRASAVLSSWPLLSFRPPPSDQRWQGTKIANTYIVFDSLY